MPEPRAVEWRADDAQVCADAHIDGLAVVRFYTTLVDLPEDLAAEITGAWFDAYLDVRRPEV